MKKHQAPLFPNLHIALLLFFLLTLFGFGHGSNHKNDGQVGRLMSLRHAKMYPHGGRRVPPRTEEERYNEEDKIMVSLPEVNEGSVTADDDLIAGGLPGQPPSSAKFNQYAGYVNVDKRNGRSLFYYFAESADTPSKKPLVLWLNGGPGCSSLGLGAFVEVGPFGVNPDGKTLYSRRFAWNRVANMLFLESPASVGFSYSNTTSDYAKSGDNRTAQDSLNFLLSWFERYPHYKSSDFYIAGESYAGFYIPELADLIINTNKMSHSTFKIPLKGIMIGNGIMNEATDERGLYDYLWSHALISDETHRGVSEDCFSTTKRGMKCYEFQYSAVNETGSIDFYNIYAPLCSNNSRHTQKNNVAAGGFDPCESDYVHAYLNLPVVQKAMHANTTKLNYTWELCSNEITSWTDSPLTMFPIYKRLFKTGLRILLYSGDIDAVVPVTGTRYSINAMNLTVVNPWHPWQDGTQEVGGYKVGYEGLTFATVRGAERSSTSTVPSADCLDDAAVDSSATAVRHFATAMADEQPRKMFLPEEEDNHERGTSLFPNFDNLTPEQWNAVRHVFSLSLSVSSMKLSGASLETGSTNEVSSYDEDEELRMEEQMDRSRRDGRPEESGRADQLQTVDLMDRSDVHSRPSERQNDGFFRDDRTVDLVDCPDIHGRPSER
ncbi:unnamed protein product [Cuscuta campestris]|uniref:Carboxypeptidase n=1 Tax=Cuscuta campestris TaxID=132261 RepID=A0A484L802_9ASTE|nr:unnamed protein product [Cuscuta campestris]